MTVRSSLYLNYDGKSSSEFGLLNINVSDGMLEETFLPERKIIEQFTEGKDRRYMQGVSYEPLELELEIAFGNGFNNNELPRVAQWLCKNYYKPLFFSENPERIYYAMYVNEPRLIHTGYGEGYISITMRCDSQYTYSPFKISNIYDLSNNTSSGTVIHFDNKGHVPCYPELSIEMLENGDFSIINHANNESNFKFTGLANNEKIYINNETRDIVTDITDLYRYNNFNNEYLEMALGVNNLTVYGKSKIRFRYRFKTYQ